MTKFDLRIELSDFSLGLLKMNYCGLVKGKMVLICRSVISASNSFEILVVCEKFHFSVLKKKLLKKKRGIHIQSIKN